MCSFVCCNCWRSSHNRIYDVSVGSSIIWQVQDSSWCSSHVSNGNYPYSFPCKLFAQLNIPISSSIGACNNAMRFSIPFRISLKLPSTLQSANRTRGRFVAWNMKSDSEKWVEICSINLQKATPLQLFTYFLCLLRSTTESESRPSRRQKRELEILLSQSFLRSSYISIRSSYRGSKMRLELFCAIFAFWTERRSSSYVGTKESWDQH